jgi:hypothetical protein
MDEFQKAVEAFLALPEEEQRRRIEEAGRRAKEISDAFDRAISFTTDEELAFIRQPMTI